jgi:hypothetical protein
MKLLVREPGSAAVQSLWASSAGVVSSLLLYPEARAALAAARRARRVGGLGYGQALELLEQLWRGCARIRVTPRLVRRAGDLAEEQALRGYDAVHLASFEAIAADDALLVTVDGDLRRAALALGFPVARVVWPAVETPAGSVPR